MTGHGRLPSVGHGYPIIGVVGPCTSGKSTLVSRLRDAGYVARAIAQEHSYVKDMWKKLVDPHILVFLAVSHDHAARRRSISWGPERLVDQADKLAHARQHADLVLDTDELSSDEVTQAALDFIRDWLGQHPDDQTE